MQFYFQQNRKKAEDQEIPSLFVELVEEIDFPLLFSQGFIELVVPDQTGEDKFQFVIYIKGRGITPHARRK